MSLLPFIEWCNKLWIGEVIRKSTWLFPLVETIHLLGLALLLGTILIVNMCALGAIMRGRSISHVATQLATWTYSGLFVMLATGVLLFASEPMKCYESPPFRVKMIAFLLAVVYQLTIYRKLTKSDEIRSNYAGSGALAGISLLLWFGVALAGRAIGFY
jgi:hypothetical protein